MNYGKNSNYFTENFNVHYDSMHEALPPAFYEIKDVGPGHMIQYRFTPVTILDRLIPFKNGSIGKILADMPNFFSQRNIDIHKEMGIAHKLGMIMYGPPGTGKTSAAFLLMDILIAEYNVVALNCTGKGVAKVLNIIGQIRKRQDNPIVVFWDEFDQITLGDEEALLTFLDGTSSVNDCIVIACTNYADRIPDRIKYRSSRIKHLVKIDRFPRSVYKAFIADKFKNGTKEERASLEYLAHDASLTLDQLKHVILDYRLGVSTIEEGIINVTKQLNTLPEQVDEDSDEDDEVELEEVEKYVQDSVTVTANFETYVAELLGASDPSERESDSKQSNADESRDF